MMYENKHMKRCSTHPRLVRKCKLKQGTTTHLLEWPKSRILITPNAGEDVGQQELSFIADGNAKWYSHFRTKFQFLYQTNHTLTI